MKNCKLCEHELTPGELGDPICSACIDDIVMEADTLFWARVIKRTGIEPVEFNEDYPAYLIQRDAHLEAVRFFCAQNFKTKE